MRPSWTAPRSALIREVDGEVEIEVDGKVHRVGSLIVAAGAWTPTVLGRLGVDIPLEVTLEQVVYMEAADPRVVSTPPVSRSGSGWTSPRFYGFPIFGEPAVKIAWDRCEIVTDPESRRFEPRDDVTEAVRVSRAGTSRKQSDLSGWPRRVSTRSRPIAISSSTGCRGPSNIFTVVGAGHAFKFASLLGRILVDLALDGDTAHDISALAADRPILQEKDPVRSYMV